MSKSDVEREFSRLISARGQVVPGQGGIWHVASADEDFDCGALAAWADALRDQVPIRSHKQRADRSASHHVLFGRPVFVKTWVYRGLQDSLKQAGRPGKAKKAWAGGLALLTAGFSTPAPLVCLELRNRVGVPLRSIYVGDYWKDAVNARHWLRRHAAHFTPAEMSEAGQRLVSLWSSLREQGVYHADFKLYNLLVRPGDGGGPEEFSVIDVDALQIGRPIGRREILRNLVQLNGSLGGWVPKDIRMDWLTHFAQLEPWCLEPRAVEEIERKTAVRLKRQLRRIDGP